MRLVTIIAFLTCGSMAFAEPRIESAKTSAGKALPAGEWSSQTTPPLPDGKSWVIYGYGTKFSSQIADGIRVGSIYCAVRASGVERVSATISELGVQGVHPVPASWWPTKDEEARAYAWVMDGHEGPMPDAVRKTYCPWQKGNGVIVAALPDGAKQFLASLACK